MTPIVVPFITKRMAEILATSFDPEAKPTQVALVARQLAIEDMVIDAESICMVSPYVKQPIEMVSIPEEEHVNHVYERRCSSVYLGFLPAENHSAIGSLDLACTMYELQRALIAGEPRVHASAEAVEYVRNYNHWINENFGSELREPTSTL